MTIDEIFEIWSKDATIDRTELGKEAAEIPKLHNKYYRIYINEKFKLLQLESDFKIISGHRYDFYAGSIDDDTLNEMGWKEDWERIGRRTILKTDINRYLESDKVLIEKQLKIAAQREKVTLLDSIIKSIVNRNYQIKSAIDWARFQVGA